MGFDLDYIPIPHGAEPPMFIYETDEEFQQQLEIHRHAIHIRTLYAIKYAYDTKFNGDITIAFLNDQDTLLQCSPHEWVKNLKSTLDYFVEIEEYEKCSEVKELIDNLQK